MMTKLKKSALAFSAACALALTGGLTCLKTLPASAEEVSEGGYYGKKLENDVAKAFYNELVEMTMPTEGGDESSEFRQGAYHVVENSTITDKIDDYKGGDRTLVKQFGAALDCFRYDYADLFYIDFDALTFEVVNAKVESAGGDAGELQATAGDSEYEEQVRIGAGRADSYFLYDITAEELNKGNGLYEQYTTAYNAFKSSITGSTAKEKALNLNNAILAKYLYGYDFANNGFVDGVDRFVSTTYSIVSETEKGYADSEGLARIFKAVLNDLEVECELVSGYIVDENGNAKSGMWNYVKDGSDWYAVDMALNVQNKNSDYFWLTGETFKIDHFEDQVVSLSKHKMPYPTLTVSNFNVETGELLIAKDTYEERDCFAVKYSGSDTLKLRIKEGSGWGDWMTFDVYGAPAGETAEPEDGDGATTSSKVEEGEDGITYLFDLTEGEFEVGIFSGTTCKQYSSTVYDSMPNVVPVALKTDDIRTKAQDVTKPLTINITFNGDFVQNAGEVEIEYTVSSPFGYAVNEEEVKKYSGVKNITWNYATGNLSFEFTPSNLLEHNGLCYSFTPTNVVTTDGAVPFAYSVVFAFNAIKASKAFGGSNLYTDVVSQPSLVYNNDLSLSGWTYDGGKKATDNMRSSMALSVSKPAAGMESKISAAVDAATSELLDADDVILKSESYLTVLTLDGKSVSIPQSASLQLAFPYPDGYGPDSTGVVYKVFRIGLSTGTDDEVSVAECEMLDTVTLRQGLVVSVNKFSCFVVVAIDADEYTNTITEKTAVLQTSGVGGTITTDTNKAVNTLQEGGSVTYTFTPDAGYELDFLLVNGTEVAVTGGTYTLTYNKATKTNTILYAEFISTDVKNALGDDGELFSKSFAEKMAQLQTSGTAYTPEEKAEIEKDYPSGGSSFVPDPSENPGGGDNDDSNTLSMGSTKMQLIILSSVVGAIAVIGSIIIVYCAAIRPKIIREREEEAARIAANRERRANRNRMQSAGSMPRDPRNNYPPKM